MVQDTQFILYTYIKKNQTQESIQGFAKKNETQNIFFIWATNKTFTRKKTSRARSRPSSNPDSAGIDFQRYGGHRQQELCQVDSRCNTDASATVHGPGADAG